MTDPLQLATTWLFGLGQEVLLPSGHVGSVRRRIESLSRSAEVSRIYTVRASGANGVVFSVEVAESKLRQT